MNKFFSRIILVSGLALGSISVWAQQSAVITMDFDAAATEDGFIYKKIKLQRSSIPHITLENIRTAKAVLPAGSGNALPNSFEPDVAVAIERKVPYAILKFPRQARINNEIVTLESADIKYTEEPAGSRDVRQRPTFADNSVLATGTWYKIAVKNRGVQKLDYNFFSTLGINMSQMNPANIRIYGNGGKMMSEKAGSSDNYDDLNENAIWVSTTGSAFTSGDYVLFYADGPTKWSYESTSNTFVHTSNIYEDYSYYFVNVDMGPGKRIGTLSPSATPVATVTDFDNYWLQDRDSFSASALGRVWWDKLFFTNVPSSLTQSIAATLYEPAGDVFYKTLVGHENTGPGMFTLRLNNANINDRSLNALTSEYQYYTDGTLTGTVTPASANLNFQYTYSSGTTGKAFVDYLQLNYKSRLRFNGTQLNFRNLSVANLGLNNFVRYTLDNVSGNVTVWDITDPFNIVQVNGTASGGQYTFLAEGNMLREFIAFNGSSYHTPVASGRVDNQNLHGIGYRDLLIITHPSLLGSAREFADYKKSAFGQSVEVVTVNQIYNEFSSGGQDIVGIRNFIKMFYDRATSEAEIPKGFLLYGNGSYDFKDRIGNNTNFVPAFQSVESSSNDYAFTSDDFYALLDDGEDINSRNSLSLPILDVSVGRLPVNNEEEGRILLDKYRKYHNPESFGPWKNNITFVADDKDLGFANPTGGMNHLDDCEYANSYFLNNNLNYSLHKIYADAYSKKQTSSGSRFPDVNKAINDQIFAGTLYMSYSGHGSPQRWAHEAILTAADYDRWNNISKLPLLFTGTCDFSRFDQPGIRSAGVQLLKKANGGAIALISTTQIVYSTGNKLISKSLVDHLFTRGQDGRYSTIGDAFRLAKNENPNSISNSFRYALLGDPTMHLQIPVNKVITDRIYNVSTGTEVETDTMSALGKYIIEGHIADWEDNDLSSFNGTVYISIYDKAVNLQTLPNEKMPTPYFTVQNNVLARVIATVTNGKFKTQFLLPKDIIYDFGSGKIGYYAHSDREEAKGFDTSFVIGGLDPNAQDNDGTGPVVKPFIDNNKFRNGGVVGANPMLYVELYDDNGINVSGSSLGHDLVAILDEDESNPYVMNSYYNTYPNDYQNGYVNFQFYHLPEGKHTVKVRAWDIFNNSGEGTVTFEVINPDKGFIGEIFNYPNPFSQTTHFVIQHNQEGKELDIQIRIYSPSGRLVGYAERNTLAEGNRTEISWDATTVDGRPLEAGIYFYRVDIHTEDGKSAHANQKLVYLPQ